ncbi:MAG TPA: hypothetical protein VF626_04210 [Chthoniobacterales bacterium]
MLPNRCPSQRLPLRKLPRGFTPWVLKSLWRGAANRGPELENDLLRKVAPDEKRADELWKRAPPLLKRAPVL